MHITLRLCKLNATTAIHTFTNHKACSTNTNNIIRFVSRLGVKPDHANAYLCETRSGCGYQAIKLMGYGAIGLYVHMASMAVSDAESISCRIHATLFGDARAQI